MKNRPPRLALWLLERFGESTVNPALVGDLNEQFQQHGSSFQYWRQTLAALLWGMLEDLRAHKLLAIRTVLTGWLSAYLTSLVAVRLLFDGRLRLSELQWGDSTTAAIFVTFCLSAAVSGYIVARLPPRPGLSRLLGYIAGSVLIAAFALPWNSLFLQRDLFLALLPFHVAYGFFGFPVSIVLGAVVAPKPRTRSTLST
jgi:hypothetical protein